MRTELEVLRARSDAESAARAGVEQALATARDELATAIATADELRAGAEAAPAAEEALATLRDELTQALAEREAVHTELRCSAPAGTPSRRRVPPSNRLSPPFATS